MYPITPSGEFRLSSRAFLLASAASASLSSSSSRGASQSSSSSWGTSLSSSSRGAHIASLCICPLANPLPLPQPTHYHHPPALQPTTTTTCLSFSQPTTTACLSCPVLQLTHKPALSTHASSVRDLNSDSLPPHTPAPPPTCP